MTTLISNIRQLVGVRAQSKLLRGSDLTDLSILNDAWVITEDGVIASYGTMSNLAHKVKSFRNSIDAAGSVVMPCWCDSHTHLVFAASREDEFVSKIKGATYAEIAAKGGGILNSAKKLNDTSEDELFRLAWIRLQEVIRLGTGAIEIKSGYGLTVESELKILRVIRRLKERSQIPIKATFLGAHAYPLEFVNDHDAYIKMVIQDMLPVIAAEKLADYIDVFCENGFFSALEMETICLEGLKYGLKAKVHVNQLHSVGGIHTAAKFDALSMDHLEVMTDDDIDSLAGSASIGTLLPSAAFFLGMKPPAAREMINKNCAIAIASDYNPGSSPSGNMNLVLSMSCIQMKLLPSEAINAATMNAAYAMGLEETVGSITVGKVANLIITTPVPSVIYLPYAFGSSLIDRVMVRGDLI